MAVINLSINIPDALADALNQWRLEQKNQDGSLTYPTPQEALKSFIRARVREIAANKLGDQIS